MTQCKHRVGHTLMPVIALHLRKPFGLCRRREEPALDLPSGEAAAKKVNYQIVQLQRTKY